MEVNSCGLCLNLQCMTWEYNLLIVHVKAKLIISTLKAKADFPTSVPILTPLVTTKILFLL